MDREVLLQHSKRRNDGLFQCGQCSVWLLETPQKEGRKSLTAEVNLTVNLGLETPRRNTSGVSVKMSLQRFL